jgi:hypothetical protein
MSSFLLSIDDDLLLALTIDGVIAARGRFRCPADRIAGLHADAAALERCIDRLVTATGDARAAELERYDALERALGLGLAEVLFELEPAGEGVGDRGETERDAAALPPEEPAGEGVSDRGGAARDEAKLPPDEPGSPSSRPGARLYAEIQRFLEAGAPAPFRLVLRLEPPGLHALPWEHLRWPLEPDLRFAADPRFTRFAACLSLGAERRAIDAAREALLASGLPRSLPEAPARLEPGVAGDLEAAHPSWRVSTRDLPPRNDAVWTAGDPSLSRTARLKALYCGAVLELWRPCPRPALVTRLNDVRRLSTLCGHRAGELRSYYALMCYYRKTAQPRAWLETAALYLVALRARGRHDQEAVGWREALRALEALEADGQGAQGARGAAGRREAQAAIDVRGPEAALSAEPPLTGAGALAARAGRTALAGLEAALSAELPLTGAGALAARAGRTALAGLEAALSAELPLTGAGALAARAGRTALAGQVCRMLIRALPPASLLHEGLIDAAADIAASAFRLGAPGEASSLAQHLIGRGGRRLSRQAAGQLRDLPLEAPVQRVLERVLAAPAKPRRLAGEDERLLLNFLPDDAPAPGDDTALEALPIGLIGPGSAW